MQLQINAPEIKTVYEQQLFNGKNFHVFIYNKTESISGLHQHDYYEFTLVLTGRYYQEINGKLVLQFELGSADWQQRAANSKFAPKHDIATAEPGHIMLQDHNDKIAFRQIRIRAL